MIADPVWDVCACPTETQELGHRKRGPARLARIDVLRSMVEPSVSEDRPAQQRVSISQTKQSLPLLHRSEVRE